MMFKTKVLSLLSIILISPLTIAAEVELTWTDPSKFIDISEGDKNRHSFRENVFYNFEKHFKKMAKDLPEDQVLKVEITNLDLAGTTQHAGINRVRIVKQNYPPRIMFNYQLLNADKTVDMEGEENLKDFSFMSSPSLRYKNDALGYEMQMLDKWFKATFESKVVDKK